MPFTPFLLLLAIGSAVQTHAMDLIPADLCEKQLESQSPSTGTAKLIVQRAFERNQVAKVRFEGPFRDKCYDHFGLWDISKDIRSKLKMRLENGTLSLEKPDGTAIYKALTGKAKIVHWFDRRRLNGHDPEVLVSDEVGWVKANSADPEIKEYVSFRNLRGNRFLVTLGLQVPCTRLPEFRSIPQNSLVHVSGEAGRLCRVPLLSVNTH